MAKMVALEAFYYKRKLKSPKRVSFVSDLAVLRLET